MKKESYILTREEIVEYFASLPEKGRMGVGKGISGEHDKDFVITACGNVGVDDEEAFQKEKKAELHENYTDVFIVLEGKEDLWIGGEITDAVSTNNGEWRGLTLIGAIRHHVKAGDVVVIPKGIAHKHGVGDMKMIVVKTG